MTDTPLRVGISACFFHADPQRPVFKGKTLLYMEQSLGHWVMSTGAVAVLLPTAPTRKQQRAMLQAVDALVLHGGADVSPKSYGEEAREPQWQGDLIRDTYESDLLHTCMELDKPVLGICRGMQLINVALGGTLLQDIATQRPQCRVHRDWNVYDQLFHDVILLPHTGLQQLYAGTPALRVNSIHHQGIKDLAPGLRIEAMADDGIVEAVRWTQSPHYVLGVQWHPEFHDENDTRLLAAQPILNEFLHDAALRR